MSYIPDDDMKLFLSEIIDKILYTEEKPVIIPQTEKKIKKEEEECFEYDGLTYMQRKIKKMQKSAMKEFGSSLGDCKKSYSKVEKEQMELKKQREAEIETINDKNIVNYVVTKKKESIEKEDYLNNQEKPNDENDITFLNKKRELEKTPEEVIHGYTPIKKDMIMIKRQKRNEVDYGSFEDFGTMMSKAVKAKPRIQLDKESYIKEIQKQKESEVPVKTNSSSNENDKVIRIE